MNTTPAVPPPRAPRTPEFHVHFEHGLGDSANFARMIPLYSRRGWQAKISTTPDKAWLFRAVGANVVEERGITHPWGYPDVGTQWEPGRDWAGNKTGCNLSRSPLPDIGHRDALWPEICQPISIREAVSVESAAKVSRAINGLPRPLVLLHSIGNTSQAAKSLSADQHFPFYKQLLDRSNGTLILLDWDNRVPTFPHYRLRRLDGQMAGPTLEDLAELICASDLLIGVDSGPFHLAGLTETPRVGLFRDGFYPSTYCVPSPNTLCVTGQNKRDWNRHKRIAFAIAETDWTAEGLAQLALGMIDDDPVPPMIRQFLSWCRGSNPQGMSEFCDRHLTFRAVLRRAKLGTWVETGTIRAAEDWAGAGYSTYLFGAWLRHQRRGKLFSVDTGAANCDFARKHTAVFGDAVEVVNQCGEDFIGGYPGEIDLLYCDSCDTTVPEHAAVCLAEVKAAMPKLAQVALVAFDDSPFSHGSFIGKGGQAIPYLLSQGWRIVSAGYQVIIERTT